MPAVLKGRFLTKAEEDTLIALWCCHGVGIAPSFPEPRHAKIRAVCEKLRADGVLYMCRGDDEMSAGYCFRDRDAEKLAEELFNDRGITFSQAARLADGADWPLEPLFRAEDVLADDPPDDEIGYFGVGLFALLVGGLVAAVLVLRSLFGGL